MAIPKPKLILMRKDVGGSISQQEIEVTDGQVLLVGANGFVTPSSVLSISDLTVSGSVYGGKEYGECYTVAADSQTQAFAAGVPEALEKFGHNGKYFRMTLDNAGGKIDIGGEDGLFICEFSASFTSDVATDVRANIALNGVGGEVGAGEKVTVEAASTSRSLNFKARVEAINGDSIYVSITCSQNATLTFSDISLSVERI